MSGDDSKSTGSGNASVGLLPINPKELGAPRGYSHGILTPPNARLLFVAGQVGWDAEQRLVSEDFLGQFDQALTNVVTVVQAAGGDARHIARLTIYVLDKHEYLEDLRTIGEAYRRVMGRHYPAIALVEVRGLIEPGSKVEIEGTAVIP